MFELIILGMIMASSTKPCSLAKGHLLCSFWSFFFNHATWQGILVPPPGIKYMFPTAETWSPNHWTAREVPSTAGLTQIYGVHI